MNYTNIMKGCEYIYMGESIITRAVKFPTPGGGITIGDLITTNGTFTVNKTGNWVITCIGGGGAGGASCVGFYRDYSSYDGGGCYISSTHAPGGGGGSGFIKSITKNLKAGDAYTINIGVGGKIVDGKNGGTGGTTKFGSLVSANGGTGGASGIGKTPSEYSLSGGASWAHTAAGGNGYYKGNNVTALYKTNGSNNDSAFAYFNGNNRSKTGGDGGLVYYHSFSISNLMGIKIGCGGKGATAYSGKYSTTTRGSNTKGTNGIDGGIIICYVD